MTSIIKRVLPLKPEIRLAQAVSEFEADLSTEQKAIFRSFRSQCYESPPGIGDVMRFTAEIDLRAASKSGAGRCFGPRLTNILQATQQYAALGDVIIGGSQNIIACGVWSMVRIALLAMVNISSYMDKLSSLLMAVGRKAPRYQQMALLYPRSRDLQSYLSEYFLVAVRLCHQLHKITQKSALGKYLSFFGDSDLRNYQSNFDLWADSIRDEVGLLVAQRIGEQSSMLGTLSKFSQSESYRKNLRAHLRILDACSQYDHQTTWKEIRKAGNSTLLNQFDAYQEWKVRNRSGTLICTGKLGFGKSVLLANMVDNINLQVQTEAIPVVYFFCRHDIAESLKARTILGSLARQLLCTFPGQWVEESDNISALGLGLEQILSFLSRNIPPSTKAFLILDGLDECNDSEREVILEQLRMLQDKFTLLICYSFRSEAQGEINWDPSLYLESRAVSIPEDNPDIAGFVDTELEKRIGSGSLTVGDPTLVLEIRTALLNGAHGMFLWVVLQIASLCIAQSDEAIRHALKDLPEDLPATFSRILQKSQGKGKNYQQLTLQLCVIACRPLTTEEFREALSVTPYDTEWNQKNYINNIFAVLAYCGSLVTLDEESLTVRLLHHSVKQFLIGGLERAEHWTFTSESANKAMRDIIITYLNYGMFENQLSSTVIPQIMAQRMPSRVVNSTLPRSNKAKNLALKLLKASNDHDFDIGNILIRSKEPPSQNARFHFYEYARLYWLKHIIWGFEDNSTALSLFLRLMKNDRIDINTQDDNGQVLLSWASDQGLEAVVRLLLKKGADIETKDGTGKTPLWLAADKGHEPVVRLLLEKGANSETENDSGQKLLWRAVDQGQEAIVRLLLEKGAEIETTDQFGRTPLSWAASQGHKGIVRQLLEKGADIETADEHRQTPLWRAAYEGQEAVVRLLLDNGADIETEDDSGQRPLSCATYQGNEAVVRELLKNGPYIEQTDDDDSGQTPLSWAADQGHTALVRQLLEQGANIVTKSDNGQTPLLWATYQGHEAIVQLLLEKGAYIEVNDQFGRTPLSWAAGQGHKTIVRELLERGADIETKDDGGQTPLSWAADQGHTSVVGLLLENGANIETKSHSAQTPLSWAAYQGHEAVVRELVKKGSDVDSKDQFGQTSLSWAAYQGHMAVVRELLENGVDIETKDKLTRTPLMWAAYQGHDAVVRLLLEEGADIEIDDQLFRTALSWAVYQGHEAVVRLLLEEGADIESEDQFERTPLSLAAFEGHEAILRILLEKGADIESKDQSGRTALSLAACEGHEAIVRLLVENGADIKTEDKDGLTPFLLWAEAHGQDAVIDILDPVTQINTSQFPIVE